jgi:precorrin-6B methylase 2
MIDDVCLDDDEDKGYPILFTNTEIRKMLSLAKAGPRDVFYDLGSGWGQNLIVALTEFKVSKAVGIEQDRERHHVSQERLENRRIPAERVSVARDEFERVLSGRAKGVNLLDATIVFYGLSTNKEILNGIKKRLRDGARLVYYYLCLFPEIMPDRVDYPFFVSVTPFKRPRSQYEWLSSIVQKSASSLRKRKKPSLQELWDELTHDYDVKHVADRIDDYKRRLARTVNR